MLIDPEASIRKTLNPDVLVDAILAKKNLGTRIQDASLVIGLGPGFQAGKDVHYVVETNRGHHLGRVIQRGRQSLIPGSPERSRDIRRKECLGLPPPEFLREKRRSAIPWKREKDCRGSGICHRRQNFRGSPRGFTGRDRNLGGDEGGRYRSEGNTGTLFYDIGKGEGDWRWGFRSHFEVLQSLTELIKRAGSPKKGRKGKPYSFRKGVFSMGSANRRFSSMAEGPQRELVLRLALSTDLACHPRVGKEIPILCKGPIRFVTRWLLKRLNPSDRPCFSLRDLRRSIP